MTTAQSKEIRAFCSTIDMETPRTLMAIITDLRNHYNMFWFDEDKVRHVLVANGATSFTLGNDKEYFYFADEALERLLMPSNEKKRVFARLEKYKTLLDNREEV